MSWFKDGKLVKSGDKVKVGAEGDEYFVELIECDAGTAGEYTCTASNVAGDACCTVNVIVTGACHVVTGAHHVVTGAHHLNEWDSESLSDVIVEDCQCFFYFHCFIKFFCGKYATIIQTRGRQRSESLKIL